MVKPVGIPSHELGHVILDRSGAAEDQFYNVLNRMGIMNNIPVSPFREVTATLRAQKFLVEHGFPIPPESNQYLRRWQDHLFEALRGVIRF